MTHRIVLALLTLFVGCNPCRVHAQVAVPTRASIAVRIQELDAQLHALREKRGAMARADDQRASRLGPRVLGGAGAGMMVGAALPWVVIGVSNGVPHSEEEHTLDARYRVYGISFGTLGAGLAIGGLLMAVQRSGQRQNSERIAEATSDIDWLSRELRRMRRLQRLYDRAEARYSLDRHGASLGVRWQY